MKPRVSVDCTVGQGQEIWALLQDSDHTGICGGEEIFTNPNWSGMQQPEICSKQNGIQLAYISKLLAACNPRSGSNIGCMKGLIKEDKDKSSINISL